MAKVVMPKNSALLEEVEAVLKIYYDAGGWLSNDEYKRQLKAMIGSEQYESSYTKKAQITSYFGFTEWEDIANDRSLRRITERGKRFYKHLQAKDQEGIFQDLVTSLETNTFGRNNFGSPASDSDVEPPVLFVRAIMDLGYLTYKEFAFLLWKLEDCGGNYTDAKQEVIAARSRMSFDIPAEATKYTDAKPITVLVRWGLLAEDDSSVGGTHIIINPRVLEKYRQRLLNLKIYNIDKDVCKGNVMDTSPIPIQNKISIIKEYMAAKGFNYAGDLIENFYLSLKSKPFVILAGTSGTGKTRLVKLFAEAIGAKMQLVPVRPDWSDSSDLFGHNDLSGKFHPGAIIDFIKQAEREKSTPHFLCLDEMNLARVEYYLSDFLSIIETRDRNENGIIETDSLVDVSYFQTKEAREKYGRVYLPENLYIIGTVNMDETTFPFSKKVLDRANTIEFSFVNLMAKATAGGTAVAQKLDNSFLKTEYLYLRDCDDEELIDNICSDLEELNQILVKANLHVGYRVRDEISFYMMNNKKADLLTQEAAFDHEIMQKILPRVQGSSAAIKDVLSELFIKCAGDYTGFAGAAAYEQMNAYLDSKSCKYPNSTKKIAFMMRRYEEDGFTSYWL